MSRCGSTLIAQMLAALPQNIVISEAPPIDGILRGRFRGATEEQKIAWLRGMLSALGQRRNGDERQFFVKFDSWHTFNLPLIRRAFPEVPWIFLYRDPLEVMVSQLKQRAMHMVPGLIELGLPGLDLAAAAQMPAEEYCARVLSHICAAALEQLHSGGRAVNYLELPDAVWTSLREYFNLDCTEEDLDRMRHVTQFDAKNPSLFFAANSAEEKEHIETARPRNERALDRADLRGARGAATEAEPGLIEDGFVVVAILIFPDRNDHQIHHAQRGVLHPIHLLRQQFVSRRL